MNMTVILRVEGPVAVVELNRPEVKNAVNADMRGTLHRTLDEVAQDEAVRAVIITGAGGAFCSGGDFKSMASHAQRALRSTTRSLMHDLQPLLECITRMDKPVIAAVNGPAVGFGMSLALACDLMVMSTNAYLLPQFIKLGLIPDGGAAWFLARHVGYARMFEILAGAQKLGAQYCVDVGIANRVVGEGEAVTASVQWAQELAAMPPLAMALTKRLARLSVSNQLEETLLLEAEFQGLCGRSEDAREAVAAMSEKRQPKFTGR